MNLEFSRTFQIGEIGDGVRREVAASETERAALARRFGLRSLAELSGVFDVIPIAGGVRVAGSIKASAVQACAISGEDVAATIDEPVDLVFVHDIGEAEEIELEQGDCDVLPIEGHAIDLGEIAAQTFGLALDPYPRAEAAKLEAARRLLISEEEAAREAEALKVKASPFAVLKRDE